MDRELISRMLWTLVLVTALSGVALGQENGGSGAGGSFEGGASGGGTPGGPPATSAPEFDPAAAGAVAAILAGGTIVFARRRSRHS